MEEEIIKYHKIIASEVSKGTIEVIILVLNICAIMIDIDHFKNVNDTYGHAVGDVVLCSTANTIINSLRSNDIVCRYGGEEFAVFLYQTDIHKAQTVAERIRENIMNTPTETSKGKIFVTASLGIARIRNSGPDNVDKLFDRADNALYTAKEEGRNKVVIF